MRIYLYDDISSETLKQVQAAIDAAVDKEPLELYISSYGGDVFAALTAAELISRHGESTAYVYGLAASAASILALSCKRLVMTDHACLLIHSARYVDGSEDEGIKLANAAQLKFINRKCPGFTEKQLTAKDNWLTAEECKRLGFCDEIISNSGDKAAWAAAISHILGSMEDKTMNEEEKIVRAAEEQPVEEKKEEQKTEECKAATEADVLEEIVNRLDAIEARLTALEADEAEDAVEDGEDVSGDAIAARMSALYARVTKKAEVPVVAPVASKPANTMKASFAASKKIDLSAFV